MAGPPPADWGAMSPEILQQVTAAHMCHSLFCMDAASSVGSNRVQLSVLVSLAGVHHVGGCKVGPATHPSGTVGVHGVGQRHCARRHSPPTTADRRFRYGFCAQARHICPYA